MGQPKLCTNGDAEYLAKLYQAADTHILAAIRAGRSPLYDPRVSGVAGLIEKETGRHDFRIIDGRLQTLRRQGKIEHLTKRGAEAAGRQPGWRVVEP